MSSCQICDVLFEHRLELVEHQASLSHQIRVEGKLKKGEKRLCPVCNFACTDLAEYSKHVDSDSHIAKLRALRTKRIAMVDSCIPSKKSSRWDPSSPAYHPHPPPPPSFHSMPPPPFAPPTGHQQQPPPFYLSTPQSQHPYVHRPSPKNFRQPALQQHQQHQQPGPSRVASVEKIETTRAGKGTSPKFVKNEDAKKKKKGAGGIVNKVLATAAIVKKAKKKEIVTTPKVTGMDNKNKRYESLALKGIISTNKSRTQTMLMERQIKYSLVEGQQQSVGAADDTMRAMITSSPSIPSMSAPAPSFPPQYHHHQYAHPPGYPYGHTPLVLPPPPPHHHSSPSVSLSHSTASDATYAFCHPVHSTPHHLHESNWPEFVRGIDAIHEGTPSTSSMCLPPSGSKKEANDMGFNIRRVKEEARDEEMPGPSETLKPDSPESMEMSSLNQKISARESKWKIDYEEQKRRLSSLADRREQARRRFEKEMRELDAEEKRERCKMEELESTRASFHSDLRKVLQSHGL